MRTKLPSRVRRLPAILAIGVLAITGMSTAPAYAEDNAEETIDVKIQAEPEWSPKDSYRVGDVLQFQLIITNTASADRAVSITDSNLERYAPCKWWRIGGNTTGADSIRSDCRSSKGFITHTITAEDIAQGSFTPWVQVHTNEVRNPSKVYIDALRVEGDPVEIPSGLFTIESLTLDEQGAQEVYKAGDRVNYTVKLADTSATQSYAVTESTFEEGSFECHPGETEDTQLCGPLSHVFTSEEANSQSWTPFVKISASANGEVVRTQSMSGEPLTLQGVYPDAVGGPRHDADATLEGEMTNPIELIHRAGSNRYRIPAITVATNGDLLASYDERPTVATCQGNPNGDSPNPNSIVQQRSTDGGVTWGPKTYIHKGIPSMDCDEQEGYSDPSYIVDHETGTIFNFHVKSFRVGLPNARKYGNDVNDHDVMQAEVSISKDNGYTWEHKVITPVVNPESEDLWNFAASGQGIQTVSGPHPGRLIQQYTVKNWRGTQAVSVYSDDHGATWHRGTPVGSHMDENKVVELSDGTLMLNSRDIRSSGKRIIALSHDAGETWVEEHMDPNLIDSRNNAQIIRAFPNATADDPRAKVLLFSNAQGSDYNRWDRTHGTIWMSCDDGQTWPFKKVFREENTSYSTITVLPDGRIGLLSEDNNNSEGIYYRSFPIGWVEGACQTMSAQALSAEAGTKTLEVPVSVTNYVAPGAKGGTLNATQLPEGWSATPAEVADTASGPAEGTFTLNIPANAQADTYTFNAELRSADDKVLASTPVTLTLNGPVKPDYVQRSIGQKNTKILRGDWDGDGVPTFGVRSFSRFVTFDANAIDAKPASIVQFGRVTDTVYVGDWDGDGADSLALVRGTTAYLQVNAASPKTTKISVPKGPLKVERVEGRDVLVAAQ